MFLWHGPIISFDSFLPFDTITCSRLISHISSHFFKELWLLLLNNYIRNQDLGRFLFMLVCWWQILSALGCMTKYLAFIFKVFFPLDIEFFVAYITSNKKSVFFFLHSLICKMFFFFLWLHLEFFSLLLVSSTLIIMCLMWFSLCLYCLGFVEFFGFVNSCYHQIEKKLSVIISSNIFSESPFWDSNYIYVRPLDIYPRCWGSGHLYHIFPSFLCFDLDSFLCYVFKFTHFLQCRICCRSHPMKFQFQILYFQL